MGEPATEVARLPQRPLLKPWYRLSGDGGRAVLRYGASVLEFEGAAAARLLPHLLPLLDGTRTVDEIASHLGAPVRPAVENALRLLAEQRLLTEPLPPDVPDGAARTATCLAATDPQGRDAAGVLATLAGRTVAVVGSAPLASSVAKLLEASALGSVVPAGWEGSPGGTPDLTIVAPAAHELPALPEWNRLALERGLEWFQVLPFDGLMAAIGPVFVPRESACYECYRIRRSANIAPVPDTAAGDYPTAPAFDALLAGLAAVTAVRRLGLGDGQAVGVLLAVEQAPELKWSRHVLYRVPRCPACARGAEEASRSPWQGAWDRAA